MTTLDTLYQRGFDQSCRIGKAIKVRCSQCAALVINGIACHEIGCPNAFPYDCWQCGCELVQRKHQVCASCAESYEENENDR